MGMSKTQPMLVGALLVTVLLGFQNCSKVGVEDLSSSSDPGVVDVLDVPNGDGAGDIPDAQDPSSQPPIVKDPPTQHPPVDEPTCVPMSDVRIKQSEDKDAMKTVACLSDQGESCVLVCHRPPGNPSNAKQKMFKSAQAVQAHLAHGDSLGECDELKDDKPSDVEICEEDHVEKEEQAEHSCKEHGENHGHHSGKEHGEKEEHGDTSGKEHGEKESHGKSEGKDSGKSHGKGRG